MRVELFVNTPRVLRETLNNRVWQCATLHKAIHLHSKHSRNLPFVSVHLVCFQVCAKFNYPISLFFLNHISQPFNSDVTKDGWLLFILELDRSCNKNQVNSNLSAINRTRRTVMLLALLFFYSRPLTQQSHVQEISSHQEMANHFLDADDSSPEFFDGLRSRVNISKLN